MSVHYYLICETIKLEVEPRELTNFLMDLADKPDFSHVKGERKISNPLPNLTHLSGTLCNIAGHTILRFELDDEEK